MSEQPKRRWFQFHLSTAIVLMFVAGGLLWLNMRPPTQWLEKDGLNQQLVCCRGSGWPVAKTAYYGGVPPPKNWEKEVQVNAGVICANAFLAGLMLLLTGMVCEWLLRSSRGEDRQP